MVDFVNGECIEMLIDFFSYHTGFFLFCMYPLDLPWQDGISHFRAAQHFPFLAERCSVNFCYSVYLAAWSIAHSGVL